MAINSRGETIAAGWGAPAAGMLAALIRQSPDGVTWPPDAGLFEVTGANTTAFVSMTDSPSGLFAVGIYRTSAGQSWIVAQSTDSGLTWDLSDSYQMDPSQNNSWCRAITSDAAGNIYAAGFAYSSTGQQYGVVRELSVTTHTWTTIYSRLGADAFGIAVHPTAGIFVAGSVPYQKGSAWGTLRGVPQGLAWNWNVVDTFPSSQGSVAESIGVDSGGNLYAVGGAGPNWVVRRSTDAGATWKTIDTYCLSKSAFSLAGSITFDYLGNAYVAGEAADSHLSYHWVVRMLPVGQTTWQMSDFWQLSSGQNAGATNGQGSEHSILAVNSGQLILATGWANDSTGVSHLITRSLAVP